MAARLIDAGFRVRAYNRSSERGAWLAERGAVVVDDPVAAVRGVEAVVVCLADDAAVTATLLDPGTVDAMSPGSLLVDTGTTGLATFALVAERAEAAGLEVLDAPMTGSKLGAEGGRLTFMVGGPAERLERARPLFDAMGRHVVHAGPRLGDGFRIKYCLNMTQAVVLQGVLEGYALAKAQGLTIEALAEVFEHSAGKTGVGSFKTPYLQQTDFTPHFRLTLMNKDLRLALEQAPDRLPLAEAVRAVYERAEAEGLGELDFLATARLLGL